jgi:hypothetical protein
VYAFLRDATTETILVETFVSLVTALAFLRDAVIFGRCIVTSRIFRRYHAGFGTEHLKMTSGSVAIWPSERGQTPRSISMLRRWGVVRSL